MARDIQLAGYVLTTDDWSALEPRTRSQLLSLALSAEPRWQVPVGPDVPLPTVEPGPDASSVVIHAAAPARPPGEPVRAPRRLHRTSDVDLAVEPGERLAG